VIKKDINKEWLVIVLSFLVGVVFMFFITKITNSSHSIIKNNTQVFDKSSLAASLEKIYDLEIVPLIIVHTQANSDDLQTSADTLKNVTVWKDDGITKLVDNQPGLKVGQGYFPATTTDTTQTHNYTLNIYFELGIVYYTRKYKKLYEILGEIFPIISAVCSFFSFVPFFFFKEPVKTCHSRFKLLYKKYQLIF